MLAMATLVAAMGLLPHEGVLPSRQTSPRVDRTQPTPIIARRLAVGGLLSTFVTGWPRPVHAFKNGVPEMENYKNEKKYPGTQPALGPQSNGNLAGCDPAVPNCFSTSGSGMQGIDERRIPSWKPKAGSNAMSELLETIKAYPPGQSRIDRGGFSIVTSTPDYLYVQFESLKKGFIDDVEFLVKDGEVQVRSASRLGFLDLDVNAKRLNWISKDLRAKGWTAPAITKEEYPDYFNLIFFTYDDYIRSVLTPETCPDPSVPLECK